MDKYITPEYLKKGDKIGIAATARKISSHELSHAIELFNSWDFEVEIAPNIYKEDNQYAGTDNERIAGLQLMLDNPDIKAIVCARGGYGTVRIIDKIDFSSFVKKPKWIAGYSDITVLHSHINNIFNIETIHSLMPLNIKSGYDVNSAETLRRALTGELTGHSLDSHEYNRNGEVSGILTGGNLSVIYSLNGSISDINTDGKILFLEDLDEYLYHIDRMIVNMKRANKFNKLKGLIIGGMSDMNDNNVPFGKTAYQIIYDEVKEYDFPVCFGFPAGHDEVNYSLIMGRKIIMKVNSSDVNIQFV